MIVSSVLGVGSGSVKAVTLAMHLRSLAKQLDNIADEYWDDTYYEVRVGPIQQYLGPSDDCPIGGNDIPSFATQISTVWVELILDGS